MFTQMSVRFCLRRGISRAGGAAQRGGGENRKLIDQRISVFLGSFGSLTPAEGCLENPGGLPLPP